MNDAPRVPPRYVPVLTEVVGAAARVEPVPVAVPAPAPVVAGAPVPARAPVAALPSAEALEDQLLHRVMQRVDVALEQQLHDAVASMVLQHTHALVPRLREEIEFVVRQAVAEAVAAELAQRPPA
ncbi:hypothetical protein [Pseudorhodoferax sp. Leaf274]|uniref:hypothetical protein n=1 Tax=Pseudorhodoferax sp. Leaf274 TaxID=1736318 RepID=UPI0007032D51|nr:hypothetical protein [Pseudorhodoferax sp. Leaf274]KQP35234.1 hypothetical protein ASF44_17885 [Pseudorhodoferax sp. Leaf274]